MVTEAQEMLIASLGVRTLFSTGATSAGDQDGEREKEKEREKESERERETAVPAAGDQGQYIAIYSYRAGYFGVSLMVENLHPSLSLVLSLDVSLSENVVSHRGTLVHTDLVPPGEKVIFHHLAPKAVQETWSWEYKANYLWEKKREREKETDPRSVSRSVSRSLSLSLPGTERKKENERERAIEIESVAVSLEEIISEEGEGGMMQEVKSVSSTSADAVSEMDGEKDREKK
jgi:hypothetical protein